MANEVEITYEAGQVLYFLVFNASSQIYNGTTFENTNLSHWNSYATSMTESSIPGRYYGNFPTISAGIYAVSIYQRVGDSPSSSDPDVGDGNITWNGLSETTIIPISITFLDYRSNPVPYVTFNIVDAGETETSSSGDIVLYLLSGIYTLQPLPKNGNIWTSQTINVNSENTIFTFTAQAPIVIPLPPAPPPIAESNSSIVVSYAVSWLYSQGPHTSVSYTLTNPDTGYSETHTDSFLSSVFYIGSTAAMGPNQLKEQIIGNFLESTRVKFIRFANTVFSIQQGIKIGNTLGGLDINEEIGTEETIADPSQQSPIVTTPIWSPYSNWCGLVNIDL